MILITGATGKLGSQVINTLLNKGVPANQIAAFVRDESKAGDLKQKTIVLRRGDYDDKQSLADAMKGIDKVLLVSGLDVNKVVQQHQNVVDAARKAGVNCFAYTSNCLRDRGTLLNPVMMTHLQTEDYLMASGLNYLIFRNALYMDSMALFMIGGKQVLETGIELPTGAGRVAYALRNDQAEAIGNVLAGADCRSRIYTFTGTQAYSFDEVAQALSALTGKPITYNPVDRDTYEANARQRGVPAHAVAMMASFMTDIKNGQASTVRRDLADVLGREPVNLKAGLKQLFNL